MCSYPTFQTWWTNTYGSLLFLSGIPGKVEKQTLINHFFPSFKTDKFHFKIPFLLKANQKPPFSGTELSSIISKVNFQFANEMKFWVHAREAFLIIQLSFIILKLLCPSAKRFLFSLPFFLFWYKMLWTWKTDFLTSVLVPWILRIYPLYNWL